MRDYERNEAEDWVLPKRSRPPLLGELVERIDEALVTARASEAAVMTVGAAALDAAEQARRAAGLAERASAAALAASEGISSGALGAGSMLHANGENRLVMEDSLWHFTERADQLIVRLQQLQGVPLAPLSTD